MRKLFDATSISGSYLDYQSLALNILRSVMTMCYTFEALNAFQGIFKFIALLISRHVILSILSIQLNVIEVSAQYEPLQIICLKSIF